MGRSFGLSVCSRCLAVVSLNEAFHVDAMAPLGCAHKKLDGVYINAIIATTNIKITFKMENSLLLPISVAMLALCGFFILMVIYRAGLKRYALAIGVTNPLAWIVLLVFGYRTFGLILLAISVGLVLIASVQMSRYKVGPYATKD